jgi:hypothetical protein
MLFALDRTTRRIEAARAVETMSSDGVQPECS